MTIIHNTYLTIDYVKGQSGVVWGFPEQGIERVELFCLIVSKWYPPETVGSAVKVAYFLSQYGGSIRANLGYATVSKRVVERDAVHLCLSVAIIESSCLLVKRYLKL